MEWKEEITLTIELLKEEIEELWLKMVECNAELDSMKLNNCLIRILNSIK